MASTITFERFSLLLLLFNPRPLLLGGVSCLLLLLGGETEIRMGDEEEDEEEAMVAVATVALVRILSKSCSHTACVLCSVFIVIARSTIEEDRSILSSSLSS